MKNIMQHGAARFGIPLSDEGLDTFMRYYKILEEKNSVMNLTAISGAKGVAELHFLDSLVLLTMDNFSGKTVIDIGSGAGFPGLPMKIAEPSIKLTMLDSMQKRVGFLTELCEKLGLRDVQCIHARAEEEAHKEARRGNYDYSVSRAVARLNVLCELCMPFVKPGGAFIAMKGIESDEEIKEAENAIQALGGVLHQVSDYEIPGTNVVHRVIIVKKVSETPMTYPRRFAKLQKAPL
jgi:16S rRNA (guanine527-N7)-methyltransferase